MTFVFGQVCKPHCLGPWPELPVIWICFYSFTQCIPCFLLLASGSAPVACPGSKTAGREEKCEAIMLSSLQDIT